MVASIGRTGVSVSLVMLLFCLYLYKGCIGDGGHDVARGRILGDEGGSSRDSSGEGEDVI